MYSKKKKKNHIGVETENMRWYEQETKKGANRKHKTLSKTATDHTRLDKK